MIDEKSPNNLKSFIQVAVNFVKELYSGEDIHNILVEEVDFNESEVWYITIGFDIQQSVPYSHSPLASVIDKELPTYTRKYKEVYFDKDGKVISMKIRNDD